MYAREYLCRKDKALHSRFERFILFIDEPVIIHERADKPRQSDRRHVYLRLGKHLPAAFLKQILVDALDIEAPDYPHILEPADSEEGLGLVPEHGCLFSEAFLFLRVDPVDHTFLLYILSILP